MNYLPADERYRALLTAVVRAACDDVRSHCVQQVRRPDFAVNDAEIMQGGQPPRRLTDDAAGIRDGERALVLDLRPEIAPRMGFRRNKGAAIAGAAIEQQGDVRMTETKQVERVRPNILPRVPLRRGRSTVQDVEGNRPSRRGVDCLEDGPLVYLRDVREKPVGTELRRGLR